MKTFKILYFLVVLLSFKTFAVSDKGVKINLNWETQANYYKTQKECILTISGSYNVTYWSLDTACYVLSSNTTLSSDILKVKWKNVEANAYNHVIGASFGVLGQYWTDTVIGHLR